MESFMIIANPGENSNTEINISYHTKPCYTNSKVIYTKKSDLNFLNAKVVYGSYYYNDVFDNVYSITKDRLDTYEQIKFLHYTVTLKDLDENTEYIYKVGDKTFSDVYHFKTGSNNFSFAWISDFHAYTPIPSRIDKAFELTEKIIKKEGKTDFILCGGDAVAYGGSYSFWLDMYSRDLVKNYMWVNVLGNHDYMSRANKKNTSLYFKSVNNFPKNGYDDQIGCAYHFTYGNTLFVVINSECMGFVRTSDEITKCRSWLIDVLSKSNAKYKIVCQHYDWFQGINGRSRDFGYLRYKDIFDMYNVDLALANNNHIYVRTYPLLNDKIDTAGTVYIQSPSSDDERGQELDELIYNQDIIAKRFSEGAKTIGALSINVTDNFIKVLLYDRSVNVIDECVIKK